MSVPVSLPVFVAGPASWNTIVYLDQLPEPRSQSVAATWDYQTIGGTSAGKALHLLDLGCDVTLDTLLGRDPAAERIRDALTAAGVSMMATEVEGPSERHLNLMTPQGERLSIYLSRATVPTGPPTSAELTALGQARVAVIDLSSYAQRLLQPAHQSGIEIWTDLHDYDGRREFHRPFIEAAAYVFLNADGLGEPAEFMRSCIAGGAQAVVCTLGARGALAVDAGLTWHEVSAVATAVVDTNGAGDAFLSGFLARTLTGGSVPEALQAGARQATRALATRHLSPLLDPIL